MSKTVSRCVVGVVSRCATSIGATMSIVSSSSCELPPAACQRGLREDADDEHEGQQHERRRPRLSVERRIGVLQVLEDRQRDRLQRLARIPADLVVVSAHVKRSGAVSPAARAIASVAAGDDAAEARRDDQPTVVRQRLTPSAKLASRSDSRERARAPPASSARSSGSMIIASARPPASALCWCATRSARR